MQLIFKRVLTLFITLSATAAFAANKPVAKAPSVEAGSKTFALVPEGSTVHFLATGRPSLLKISGDGAAAEGQVSVQGSMVSGEMSFNLESLKTGIETRDHHMKEKYLEVGKFPKAKLVFKNWAAPAQLFKSVKGELKEVPFKALLLLHGVEKEVAGVMDMTRDNDKVHGETRFSVKLPEYHIDIPKYAGITIAEDVNVKVNFNGTLSGH